MKSNLIYLVYDGECPLCDNYCRLVRIKKSIGELVLIDARDDSDVMQEITKTGLDIDQGMVLKMNEVLYYGPDAIHMLSLISSHNSFFNRLNYRLFKNKRLSRISYPVLRSMRNLVLKVLFKKKINNLKKNNNDRF